VPPPTPPGPATPLIPLLLFATLSGVVAALLWVRSRPTTRHPVRRSDRVGAWTLTAAAVVFLVAAPFEWSQSLFGFALPPECRSTAAPGPNLGVSADEDDAFRAEAQRGVVEAQQPDPVLDAVGTTQIAHVTGPASVDRTAERWNVYGTDLGHPFVYGDRLGLVFGDTFGDPFRNDWRSNVLAWAYRPQPDRLEIADFHTSPRGNATEILGSLHLHGWEQTVIPTYATAVGDRIIVHYMSVNCWGLPGSWAVNHAGLAVSDDGGERFRRIPGSRWGPDSGFAQVAFVPMEDEHYIFGIRAGRAGPARLARAPNDELHDRRSWRYWNGQDWVSDEAAAIPVVPAPVGELSVQWNPHHQLWVMFYLDEQRGAIVVRTAEDLRGSWTAPRLVASAVDHPELYSAYLLPEPGPDGTVYFTMSRYDIYNVLLMRTELRPVAGP
jgi:hypothetical protein